MIAFFKYVVKNMHFILHGQKNHTKYFILTNIGYFVSIYALYGLICLRSLSCSTEFEYHTFFLTPVYFRGGV